MAVTSSIDDLANGDIPDAPAWKNFFHAASSAGSQAAETFMGAQLAPVTQSIATLTAQIATLTQTATANTASITALTSSAAQLSQVGWVQIGAAVNANGMNGVVFSFPSGFTQFKIEWENLGVSTGNGFLYAQVSTNGGTNYDTGTNYSYTVLGANGAAVQALSPTAQTQFAIGPSGTQNSSGEMVFSPASRRGRVFNGEYSGQYGTWIQIYDLYYAGGTAPTNILIANGGAAFVSGFVRLSGWRS